MACLTVFQAIPWDIPNAGMLWAEHLVLYLGCCFVLEAWILCSSAHKAQRVCQHLLHNASPKA
jgi:hypothetical protein